MLCIRLLSPFLENTRGFVKVASRFIPKEAQVGTEVISEANALNVEPLDVPWS